MNRNLLPFVLGLALSAGAGAQTAKFRHPGLLHSGEDFAHIRERVAAGDAHTLEALDVLKASPPVYGDHGHNWGVNEVIKRGIQGDENYMNAYRNAARAYQLALLWRITGDTGYANAAIDVLDAYRIWNKGLGGNTNISLIPGFIGYQFINAAEIMREYEGWPQENFELFKQYMIDVWFTVAQDFLERRHDTVWRESNWYHYHSNWGLGNALFCVSLGIMCDLPDIYNYGMYWLKEGPGNESLCVTSLHPDAFGQGLCGYGWGLIPWFHKDDRGPLGYFCQMQESGRDQGHSMAALGLLSYALQSAYNQGDNAFCNLYNSKVDGQAGTAMVAGAAEYVAAYNSGVDDLPYTQNWWMGGLNGTGRGQWRPIWQLFINHYQNRMGIKMPYCETMHNIIGIERGGGSYGNNSGGYDHTGFGDLMHYDTPVAADRVPTILQPSIVLPSETRKYAEATVEPGTVIMLVANLPDGEADTGQWLWEDGATGSQRQITADHSGLYRVTYTNARGVQSTQLFSIAVRGEGIRGTLGVSASYNGRPVEGTDVQMGLGGKLTISTGYTNWNYIESEEWFDEGGNRLATGGSYTYTLNDKENHQLTFRLTNQSGVRIERVFNISYNPNDLTDKLADPYCADPSSWTTNVEGFLRQSGNYAGFSAPFIERFRAATDQDMTCWGQERFYIGSTTTGLEPGKYELGASIIATQQGKTGADSKRFVRDVYLYAGGMGVEVSSQDGVPEYFTVTCYVGADGKLSYGVKNLSDQNHGYSDHGMNWLAMDNFSLIYKGTADLADDLATLRAQLASVGQGSVPAALYERVIQARALTGDDVATAVALQTVWGDVQLVQARYADYMATCQRYQAYAEADNALATALAAFEAAATADAFYQAYDNLLRAWRTYLPQAGAEVELTDELRNVDFPSSGDVWYDTSTAWQTEAGGGNFRIFGIDGSDTQRGDALSDNMIERWCTANFSVGERLIYQSVSNMPIGCYVVSATAQKGNELGSIELFVNDGATPVRSSKVMRRHEARGEVASGLLTVGLRSATGNACQWVTLSDVSLRYLSPVLLLEQSLAEAATLDYGTDNDGALAAAVAAARSALSQGDATARMEAWHSLLDAMDGYRIYNASEEHPADMAGYIRNPQFTLGGATSWSVTTASAAYPRYGAGGVECQNTTFNISQTISQLPVGNYRVSLQARTAQGAGNQALCVYGRQTGGATVKGMATATIRTDGIAAADQFAQNTADLLADADDSRIWADVFVSDGKLTVGVASESADVWAIFTGFRLQYMGFGANDLLINWAALVEQAGAMNRDSIPAAVGQQIDAALDVDVQEMGADELSKALSTLATTLENARAVRTAYVSYLELLTMCKQIAQHSRPSLSSSLDLLNSDIETSERKVAQATTATAVSDLRADLELSRQGYVLDAVPLDGISFDLTFRLINAAGTAPDGWSTDGSGHFGAVNVAGVEGEYNSSAFFEKWDLKEYVFQQGKRPIYQTVSGVPNGNYVLTMAAFRKDQNSTTPVPDDAIYVYAGTGRQPVLTDRLDYYTVKGVASGRKIEVGLVAGANNTANWVGLADAHLIYYGISQLQLSEDDDSRITADNDGEYAVAEVVQPMASGSWKLVCLPFSLTSTVSRKAFASIRQLTGIECTDGQCNLQFTTSRTIQAGVPYLVQVNEARTAYTFENVTINWAAFDAEPLTFESNGVKVVFHPTDSRTAVTSTAAYGFDTITFSRLEVGEEVKGLSGYIEAEGTDVSVMNCYLDGELWTSMRQVVAGHPDVPVDVYTTGGTLLRQAVPAKDALQGLPAGVYVVNGKKVIR